MSTRNPHKFPCDVCGERPWIWHGVLYGIETAACGVCLGYDDEPDEDDEAAEEQWRTSQPSGSGS